MNTMWIRRFQQVAQLVTVFVVAVDAILAASGKITGRQAMWLFVTVEVPLTCALMLGLSIAVVAGVRRGDRLREATARVLGHSPLPALVRAELRAYRALWLWARGRCSGVEPGAVVLTANKGTLVLPVAFAVATVIEIVVLHLLLPWMWLRVAVALISVWSLLAMFGYLAVHRTNPHYLTETSLVLRQSGKVVTVIERSDIAALESRPRFSETAPAIRESHLFLPNTDGTVVGLALKSTVKATLPAMFASRTKTGEVNRISLYLDEPRQLLATLTSQQGGPSDSRHGARIRASKR